jgi:hypothetical protein
MEKQSEKFKQYGIDQPACYSDAFKLAKELFPRLRTIKLLMAARGMAPAPPEDDWEIPINEADVCNFVANMACDIVAIERLLIHHDLASEDDYLPLYPRWRVANIRHHVHNWKQFELYVRLCIRAEILGLPRAENVWKFNERLAETLGFSQDNMTRTVEAMADTGGNLLSKIMPNPQSGD